jgi:hypothetical protein
MAIQEFKKKKLNVKKFFSEILVRSSFSILFFSHIELKIKMNSETSKQKRSQIG